MKIPKFSMYEHVIEQSREVRELIFHLQSPSGG